MNIKLGMLSAAIAASVATSASAELLFGPQIYTLATAPQTHTASVVAEPRNTCNQRANYLLKVTNGSGSSGALVTSGTVTINGNVLAKLEELPSTSRTAEITFTPSATNQLVTTLASGKSGAAVTVSLENTAEEQVFQDTYSLTSKNQTFNKTFAGATDKQYALTVTSGPNGTSKPTFLSVRLNGTEIVTTGNVTYYPARRTVSLRDSNLLEVSTRGSVGAAVSVRLVRLLQATECPAFIGIAITAPSASSSDAQVLAVEGTAFGPADLAVWVNGRTPRLEKDHPGTEQDPYLWSTEMWLEPGPNTITAKAAVGGPTPPVELIRTVQFADVPETAALHVTPSSGISPLPATLSVTTNASEVSKLEIDFEGDGTWDLTTNSFVDEVSHTFITTGAFAPAVRVTSTTGALLTAASQVTVLSDDDIATAAAAQWTRFREKLAAQDVDGAVSLMTPPAAQRYRPILLDRLAQLPTLATSLADVELVSVDGGVAKFICLRTTNGESFANWVSFERAQDGTWQISHF